MRPLSPLRRRRGGLVGVPAGEGEQPVLGGAAVGAAGWSRTTRWSRPMNASRKLAVGAVGHVVGHRPATSRRACRGCSRRRLWRPITYRCGPTVRRVTFQSWCRPSAGGRSAACRRRRGVVAELQRLAGLQRVDADVLLVGRQALVPPLSATARMRPSAMTSCPGWLRRRRSVQGLARAGRRRPSPPRSNLCTGPSGASGRAACRPACRPADSARLTGVTPDWRLERLAAQAVGRCRCPGRRGGR